MDALSHAKIQEKKNQEDAPACARRAKLLCRAKREREERDRFLCADLTVSTRIAFSFYRRAERCGELVRPSTPLKT
jgi:hypothetical protein